MLLDTHALLWVLGSHRRLGRVARRRVDDPQNEVWVSAIAIWELAIKAARLRSSFEFGIPPAGIVEEVSRLGFHHVAVTAEHGVRAAALPPHHHDPFDRMLIAQALLENLTLVTADSAFAAYDVKVLAADA